jgi:cell division protease FtsH
LLVEMDGFESNDGVILVAATNRPDVLDPALLRPGRFDRRVVVDLPDLRGREGILAVHTRHIPMADDVDLKRVAQGSPGLSGADLANLANEAALLASRRNRQEVVMADFDEAKDKIMLGAERKSMVMSDEDKRLAAYHEAGHAIVAKLLPGAQPIHKATIIPRGQTMGMVSFLADERHSVSETRLRTHLATALGGCCAESLIFKERSTGAQSDYKQVTALARSMVCEWGMSKHLGPLSFGKEEDEVFLGKEFARTRNFSEQTAQAIDQEIRDLVLAAEETAAGLLEKNQDKLHALAQALLRFEMLDDAEIDRILALGPAEVEGRERSEAKGSSPGEETQEAPAAGEEGA